MGWRGTENSGDILVQIVENQNRDFVTHVLGTADKNIPTAQPLENCREQKDSVELPGHLKV